MLLWRVGGDGGVGNLPARSFVDSDDELDTGGVGGRVFACGGMDFGRGVVVVEPGRVFPEFFRALGFEGRDRRLDGDEDADLMDTLLGDSARLWVRAV